MVGDDERAAFHEKWFGSQVGAGGGDEDIEKSGQVVDYGMNKSRRAGKSMRASAAADKLKPGRCRKSSKDE